MSNYQSYSTFVAPTEPAGQAFSQVRVHDTVYRASSNDGAVTESIQSNDKGNAGELNPHHGTSSVLATARSPNGVPLTEILPTSLVEIDGVQAPVSFWVTEGRLQRAADGTYSESNNSAPAVKAPVEADTSDYLPIPDSAMSAITAALDSVDQGNLDGLAGVGMGFAVGRLDEAALTRKFSQVSGLDAGESHARLTTIKAAYQAQADEAVTARYGVPAADRESFYAWCRANRQGPLQEAVQKQLHAHDLSGYRVLASQWLAATPPSTAALKAAGIPVRTQGQGTEVFIRNQWMSPKAAAKAGLL